MSTVDPFQKLLKEADANDQAELKLVHNARVFAMKAYQDKPGKSTAEDLTAAKNLYTETFNRLYQKYFPQDSATTEGDRFPNRKQALDWLKSQDYKVSRGKFYGDTEDGFPEVHRDGSVSRYQVLQYGQQLDIEKRGKNSIDAHREQELKIEKLELEVEEKRIRNRKDDEKWIQKEDAWAQMASLVGLLRDTLRHHFHMGAPKLAHMSGGDQSRSPEVYEGCEEIFNKSFNEVAGVGNLDVVFDAEDEDE